MSCSTGIGWSDNIDITSDGDEYVNIDSDSMGRKDIFVTSALTNASICIGTCRKRGGLPFNPNTPYNGDYMYVSF